MRGHQVPDALLKDSDKSAKLLSLQVETWFGTCFTSMMLQRLSVVQRVLPMMDSEVVNSEGLATASGQRATSLTSLSVLQKK